MKIRMTALLIGIFALGMLRPAAPQTPLPSFQVIDIPLLSGAKESYPSAINGLGQVVGGSRGHNIKTQIGWVWTPASATTAAKIEAVIPLSGFSRSYALDINASGTVAGKSYNSDWGSRTSTKATLWLKGAYTQPVDLNADPLKSEFLPAWTLREAAAVSNVDGDGTYYVLCYGEYTKNGTIIREVGAVLRMQNQSIVTAAALQTVNVDPVNPRTWRLSINNVGQVSGDYTDYSNPPYRCLWNAADGQLLLSVVRESGYQTQAINDSGTILGTTFGSGSFATISDAPYSTIDLLKTQLPGINGESQTIPFDFNHNYQVVGQAVYINPIVRAAAFWQIHRDPVTGQPLRDGAGNLLYTYYDLAQCNITGTTLVRQPQWAQGINDSGWITGVGTTNQTAWRAFVLIPN